MINFHQYRYICVLALAVTLGLAAQPAAAGDGNAWSELVESQPEAARATSATERRVLQALSADAARAYQEHRDASAIVLPNGETLAAFIERIERSEEAGLVYQVLDPCVVLDTRLGDGLAAGETRQLRLRRPDANDAALAVAGGDCGLPGLAGDVLKTNTARAVFLNVEVFNAEGEGEISLWAAGEPEPLEGGAVRYLPEIDGLKNSVTVPMCGEENPAPCAGGDIALRARGAGADVRLSVIGYFESATNKGVGQWSNNGNDIFYNNGRVGIGISTPTNALHVVGHSTFISPGNSNLASFFGYNDALDFTFISSFDLGAGLWKNIAINAEDPAGTGKVGIGTRTPGRQLTLTECLRFDNAGPGDTDLDLCNDDSSFPDDGLTLRTTVNPASGEPIFRVLSSGGSERLRVEHNGRLSTTNHLFVSGTGSSFFAGNVGIGTQSPTEKLQVEGNIKLNGNLVSDGDICIGSGC